MIGEVVEGEWVVGFRGGLHGRITLRCSYPSPEAAQVVTDREFGRAEVHDRYPIRFWRDRLSGAHAMTDEFISGVVEFPPQIQAAMLPMLESTGP